MKKMTQQEAVDRITDFLVTLEDDGLDGAGQVEALVEVAGLIMELTFEGGES